jgi:sec-independent protein translocase protein TatA
MFGSIGVPELLLILLIVIIIFGAGKLPQLGKGMGEGIRNFRNSLKGDNPPKDEPPRTDEGSKGR